MDSTKERYFFLSGLISLSLFALLVLLVGYSLLISSKIEQFAMIQKPRQTLPRYSLPPNPSPSQNL